MSVGVWDVFSKSTHLQLEEGGVASIAPYIVKVFLNVDQERALVVNDIRSLC